MAREYHNFTVSHRLGVVGLNRTDYKVASSRELPCTEYKGRHRTQITLAPRRLTNLISLLTTKKHASNSHSRRADGQRDG